mmetsp:Transcript_14531/g.19922  ORF Transcript_14531/g.19922 Transcript_14531/m.19922 type:complete len:110 (+) Transcript_14531:845-1174(+)
MSQSRRQRVQHRDHRGGPEGQELRPESSVWPGEDAEVLLLLGNAVGEEVERWGVVEADSMLVVREEMRTLCYCGPHGPATEGEGVAIMWLGLWVLKCPATLHLGDDRSG